MSKWTGLHNPERHGQEGQGRARLWCECGSWCSEDALCDCCELVELRAEVERLTAEVEVLRNSLGHCAAENATLRENDVLWRSRMKTAEAQVERVRDGVNVVLQRAQGVREFGGRSLDWVSGAEHAAKVITDALDGDDE